MSLWIGTILAVFYGSLTSISGIVQIKKRKIPVWSALGMSAAGLIISLAAIFSNMQALLVYVLLAGLLLIHAFALFNGFHLYGRIHIVHHIVRLFITIFILVLLWG